VQRGRRGPGARGRAHVQQPGRADENAKPSVLFYATHTVECSRPYDLLGSLTRAASELIDGLANGCHDDISLLEGVNAA
jgi:hypothetical protein